MSKLETATKKERVIVDKHVVHYVKKNGKIGMRTFKTIKREKIA